MLATKKIGLLTKEEYFNLIEELKVAASRDKSKTRRQYYILMRYEILQCGDIEKLIKKRNEGYGEEQTVYFAHIDELYDIVKRAHTSTGHGGRDKMIKTLSSKYSNITREVFPIIYFLLFSYFLILLLFYFLLPYPYFVFLYLFQLYLKNSNFTTMILLK